VVEDSRAVARDLPAAAQALPRVEDTRTSNMAAEAGRVKCGQPLGHDEPARAHVPLPAWEARNARSCVSVAAAGSIERLAFDQIVRLLLHACHRQRTLDGLASSPLDPKCAGPLARRDGACELHVAEVEGDLVLCSVAGRKPIRDEA
jgi:hypothetical protein